MPRTLNLTLFAAVSDGGPLRCCSRYCFISAAFMPLPIAESGNKCRPSMCAFVAMTAASMRLYEVLWIKQSASATEIKSVYRSLAKVYHPDSPVQRSEFDETDFIEIHDAYETVSDSMVRAVYDLLLTMVVVHGGGNGSRLLVSSNYASGFYQIRK